MGALRRSIARSLAILIAIAWCPSVSASGPNDWPDAPSDPRTDSDDWTRLPKSEPVTPAAWAESANEISVGLGSGYTIMADELVSPRAHRGETWGAPQIRYAHVGRLNTHRGYFGFDLEIVRELYLGDDSYYDDTLTFGTLEAGPTYLHLAFIGPQLGYLPGVLTAAEQTGGLILDLRHNGGGDVTAIFSALSFMTPEPRPVLRSRTRSGPRRDQFTDWYEWSIAGGGAELDFPIVVLIDRYTGSAAEWMALALSTFDQVVFVGETTNGSLSAGLGRELINGWQVSISIQEVINLDGTTIEGVGLVPDELIENDPIAALERAIELAMP